MAWCGTCSSHGFLFLLQRVRKDVDRGTQHSDMFLLKAEEGREGVCAVPGQATWAAVCRWEGGQRVWGWWGAPARAPSGGQRTPRERLPHALWGTEDAELKPRWCRLVHGACRLSLLPAQW